MIDGDIDDYRRPKLKLFVQAHSVEHAAKHAEEERYEIIICSARREQRDEWQVERKRLRGFFDNLIRIRIVEIETRRKPRERKVA